MSEAPVNNSFLNVDMLLELSRPRQRTAWLWYGTVIFATMVMLSTAARSGLPNGAQLVNTVSALLMLGLIVGIISITVAAARSVQKEQRQLESVEELMQLRRWPEAAALVDDLLSRPTRTPQARFQGLVFLATVLARYHRFADAITVYEHLLQLEGLDGQTAFALKVGRAMAMLREDRLFDVDRAINELRRMAGEHESAGLGMVEVYRDVKTGHPAEAIELYERMLPAFRKQLGMRVGDVHGLAARAYELLGREEEARAAWEKGTLLVHAVELTRRYPELEATARKFPAAALPAEVA
jgi:tetratricopeptide (TPR) repeat protein